MNIHVDVAKLPVTRQIPPEDRPWHHVPCEDRRSYVTWPNNPTAMASKREPLSLEEFQGIYNDIDGYIHI